MHVLLTVILFLGSLDVSHAGIPPEPPVMVMDPTDFYGPPTPPAEFDFADTLGDYIDQAVEDKKSKKFLRKNTKNMRNFFNQGFGKFALKKQNRGGGRGMFASPPEPVKEKDRVKVFVENFKIRKDIEVRASFDVSYTNEFMFLSPDEKRLRIGIRNTTELEKEIEERPRKPSKVQGTNRLEEYKKKVRPKLLERKEIPKVCKMKRGKEICKRQKKKVKKNKRKICKSNPDDPICQKKKRNLKKNKRGPPGSKLQKREEVVADGDSLDLRDWSLVTTVKDQGDCESCWAFGALAVLEGAFTMTTGIPRDFSEQQVIDCNSKFGCEGGVWTKAWLEIQTDRYIALEADQPYFGEKEAWRCDRTTPNGLTSLMTIGLYDSLRTDDDEDTMLGLLEKYGPVIIAVHADDTLFAYDKGIFDYCIGGKSNDLNHAVVLIGYEPTYLIMKNSWGTDWGMDGYFHLARGCDPALDGYSHLASYLTVVSQDPATETPIGSDTEVYGDDTFLFKSGKKGLSQLIERDMSKIGVKEGDLITLTVLDNAAVSNAKFILTLESAEDEKVYRLQLYKDRKGYVCRQLASPADIFSKQVEKRKPCSISQGGVIEVMITSSGYSVDFDGKILPAFPLGLPLTATKLLKLEVKGSKDLFASLTLTRRVEVPTTGGSAKTCFDKDPECMDFLMNDPDLCNPSIGTYSNWMTENCPFSCALCPPEGVFLQELLHD